MFRAVADTTIAWDHAVNFVRIVFRQARLLASIVAVTRGEVARSHDTERVMVVVCKMIGDARDAGVHICAISSSAVTSSPVAAFERRPAEKDRAIAFTITVCRSSRERSMPAVHGLITDAI